MKARMNIPLTRYGGLFSWDQHTIDRLAQAAVDVAAKVGIRIEDDTEGIYLEEAERAGAVVDRNANAVLFRRKEIEQAVEVMRTTAPASDPPRPADKPKGRDERFLVGNGANLLFDWAKWTVRAPERRDLVDLCSFAQG